MTATANEWKEVAGSLATLKSQAKVKAAVNA